MIRPLLPVWLLVLLTGPLLVLCGRAALLARRAARRSGGTDRSGDALRWRLRTVGVLALVAIGLGPSVARTSNERIGVGVDVFLVVDRTGSMAAEDYLDGTTRLDGVRQDLPALVAAVPGARYSIISWDSEATRQLPLSADGRAVDAWAQTLRQESTATSSGSRLDRPLAALRTALTTAAEAQPGHVRLVFVLSDGEQTGEGDAASFTELAPLIDGGAVLGYGTAEGGQMMTSDGDGYILGADGQPGVSHLDEAALTTLAGQLGVTYLHRAGPDDAALAALVDGVEAQSEVRADDREVQLWSPVVWPAAVVLVLLLVAEGWWLIDGWTVVRRPRTGPDGRRPREVTR
ncbi:MAG TPA: VWA domain-containing protein [Cellulomonas sp.]